MSDHTCEMEGKHTNLLTPEEKAAVLACPHWHHDVFRKIWTGSYACPTSN